MKSVAYDSEVHSIFEVEIAQVEGHWVSEGGLRWPAEGGLPFRYGTIPCRLTLCTTGRWYLCTRDSGPQAASSGAGGSQGQGLNLSESGPGCAPFLWGVCRFVDGLRLGFSKVDALLEGLETDCVEEGEPEGAGAFADAREKAALLLRFLLAGGGA